MQHIFVWTVEDVVAACVLAVLVIVSFALFGLDAIEEFRMRWRWRRKR